MKPTHKRHRRTGVERDAGLSDGVLFDPHHIAPPLLQLLHQLLILFLESEGGETRGQKQGGGIGGGNRRGV